MKLLLLIFVLMSSPFSFAESKSQPAAKTQCSEIYDNFCKDFWSKPNLGNQDIKLSTGREYPLRFGYQRSGLNYSNYNYLKAFLLARKKLPKDLQKALDDESYFTKLNEFLKVKPGTTFTIEEAQKSQDVVSRLNDKMGYALIKVIRKRFEAQDPQYLKKDELSPSQLRQVDFMTKVLTADMFKIVWQESPLWQDVKTQFEQIKTEYLAWLNEREDLDQKFRDLAILRIKTISLRLPGSNPNAQENDCAISQKNAYYDSSHHELTVCAGLFGTNILVTVAHEMSHAIDPTNIRTFDLYRTQPFGEITKAYNNMCADEKLTCASYEGLKQRVLKVEPLKKAYFPSKYLQCLGQKELADFPDGRQLDDLAANYAYSSTERFSKNFFFTLTVSPKIETELGNHIKNQTYLNPCKLSDDDHERHEYNSEELLLISFEAEYRCSKDTDTVKKFETSLSTARQLTSIINKDSYASVERDNFLPEMVLRNQSKSVAEQAADNMGLVIAARLLKKLEKVEDRRLAFLAAGPLFCDPPGIFREMPDLTVSEKKFGSDGHSLNKIRRAEMMTDPIRDVLECGGNVQAQSCSL